MFIDRCTSQNKGSPYTRVLLRHGYRENGKVKLKTIANLSHCTPEELEALEIALKGKKDIPALKQLSKGTVENGKYIGSLCLLDQVARELGITKALGESQNAKRILWLIFARLLHQGSRLSATRLAQQYAVGEIMGIEGFCEDDLYKDLDWLFSQKEKIEKKLFLHGIEKRKKAPSLFLYDVSSSYLEGEENELAEYGYNRDKKKGKKQIVYGVLTDDEGDPVSIEAFSGNTSDPKTFASQIEKVKNLFGVQKVTFVGDKGMIKTLQIEHLKKEDFHYITTITKPQIEKLIQTGTLQMELFQDALCEVEDTEKNVRYIMRRNPQRALEIQETREEKIAFLEKKIEESNTYLREHPKANMETQKKKLNTFLSSRKLGGFLTLIADAEKRTFSILRDREKEKEETQLDGCFVMKTDLSKEDSSKETIHARYKDLAKVEWEFRTQKTGYLEIRAVYLRKKERTIAHLFITMLAYKIERYLREAWKSHDITVEEGIHALSRITSIVVTLGKTKIVRIPNPDTFLKNLLDDAHAIIPSSLPHREALVITRKKLVKPLK